MKRPEAFPRLYRQGGEASRFAYDMVPARVPGSAMMRIAAGQRSVSAHADISDHPHRFARALEHLLRDKAVRDELRALLDSYEPKA